MLPKLRRNLAVLTVVGTAMMPITSSAITLQEALVQAYQNNPSILSQRAVLRSQDENVAQTRAAGRGTLSLSTRLSNGVDNLNQQSDHTDSFRTSLDASLLLYDGGRTKDAIAAAENTIFSAQANLRTAEQDLLLSTATAYVDVRRDQQFLALGYNNVNLIDQQVKATQDRFDVGAVTRTDVALANARLAAARTSLAANSGALALSNEIFKAIVGAEPTNLQAPPPLPAMPSSLAEAESIAIREHPAIIATRYAERAAEFDLARARAARRPTVQLGGSVGYNHSRTATTDFFGSSFIDERESTDASVALTGSLPIYQGGALSSGMRAATQILESRKATTQGTIWGVRQATAIAWANIRVARASITAATLEIEANQIAYDGMQQEMSLGARTTLDLLDAEQELLSAKSNLTSARRDEYVAGFNLLSAMGLLTVENLNLGIPTYDPNVNFNRVRNAPVTFSGGTVLDAIGDRWK